MLVGEINTNQLEARFTQRVSIGTSGEIIFTGPKDIFNSVIKGRYVSEELTGWNRVSPHLRCLPTRKIQLDGQEHLIVRYIPSSTLSDLVNDNDLRAAETFRAFISDLESMWYDSETPYDKSRLVRDYGEICVGAITKFTNAAREKLSVNGDIFDPNKEIFINGERLGTLRDYFGLQLCAFASPPKKMVLSHGDENFGNILRPEDTAKYGSYRVIDCRFAGYHDRAWVLSNIYARTFLFNSKFNSNLNIVQGRGYLGVEGLQVSSTNCAEEIRQEIMRLVQRAQIDDPDFKTRVAAYTANNIGRSIAHLRDPLFFKVCDEFGLHHLFQSMVEARRMLCL